MKKSQNSADNYALVQAGYKFCTRPRAQTYSSGDRNYSSFRAMFEIDYSGDDGSTESSIIDSSLEVCKLCTEKESSTSDDGLDGKIIDQINTNDNICAKNKNADEISDPEKDKVKISTSNENAKDFEEGISDELLKLDEKSSSERKSVNISPPQVKPRSYTTSALEECKAKEVISENGSVKEERKRSYSDCEDNPYSQEHTSNLEYSQDTGKKLGSCFGHFTAFFRLQKYSGQFNKQSSRTKHSKKPNLPNCQRCEVFQTNSKTTQKEESIDLEAVKLPDTEDVETSSLNLSAVNKFSSLNRKTNEIFSSLRGSKAKNDPAILPKSSDTECTKDINDFIEQNSKKNWKHGHNESNSLFYRPRNRSKSCSDADTIFLDKQPDSFNEYRYMRRNAVFEQNLDERVGLALCLKDYLVTKHLGTFF